MRLLAKFALVAAFLSLLAAAGSAQNITCSSEDGKRHYCAGETRYGVDLVRQRSGSVCSEGYSWGYDDRGIWVDHGCRADFVALQPPPTITCASEDGKRHYCGADTRAGVQMIRQHSGSPCTRDYSWGYDERGVWVDHGCRADFALQTARSNDDDNPPVVTCSSDDGGRHFCEADTRRGVRLVRQISGSACTLDYSWGYDDRGIWVDHGCRAEFALRLRHHRDWDRDRDRDYDRDRDRDRQSDNYGNNEPVFADRTLSCSSDDGQRHYCDAESRAGVRLAYQRSEAACTQGYSWGYDDRGIWVDHGCRADFAFEAGPSSYDDNPPIITCSSDFGNHYFCEADTRRGVRLARQISGSACVEGYSWGYDDRGVWVDHGCRADFALRRGYRQD